MFKSFKETFQRNFKYFLENQDTLYVTDVDKDTLWDAYINSFPAEIRQEYNCNCCRHFIKNYGNVVAIKQNRIITLWNFDAQDEFASVVKKLDEVVGKAKIRDVFVTKYTKLGTNSNVQLLPQEKALSYGALTRTWEHLYFELPAKFKTRSSDSEAAVMGELRQVKDVFKRSLEEITMDAVDTVLELIAQNSLYRGAESQASLEQFRKIQLEYQALSDSLKDVFCWANFNKYGLSVSKIKNTAMGTLLMDISTGRELDEAVSAFERIMAPANYKRPNTIITKKMVEEAEKVIKEMGLEDALGRRFAAPEDLKVSNLLFVNRDVKKDSSLFGELKDSVPVNPKSFSKVDEVSMKDFLDKVLPKANGIEVFVENKHHNHFVSLIGPKVAEAPSLFKWDNPFSWSYQNALADSLKEKVKAAGGKVDGVLRFSIQWNEDGRSICDLDAHAYEPSGDHIYYASYKGRQTLMSGMLDVDMIRPISTGVENITWLERKKMREGTYKFSVLNFDNGHNTGFQAEIEFDGQIHSFQYDKKLMGEIVVATVTLDKNGFSIKPKLESSTTVQSKNIWGLDTNRFHKVSMITKSPNYWDGHSVGNEHLFFILEGAHNSELVRGFFNEFLKPELLKNKRVFEALGSRMKVEPSHKQISGIGFSSTLGGELIVKVEGSFARTLKIKF